MTFEEVMDYLYSALPMYQRVGAAAYKKDLTNTIALCEHLENPQNKFRSVHVAGTNGKGSSSHYIASILQTAGLKVGLYTSPHLKSFTERIRINGVEVQENFVVEFVESNRNAIERIEPSFFEITVAMAFDYFAKEEVDIAIIETGLGGRLDSTNVITPLVSLITNISLDHEAMLGDSLPLIAIEKAGIIKRKVPLIISEKQEEVADIFEEKASELETSIVFAEKKYNALKKGSVLIGGKPLSIDANSFAEFQLKNLAGVLCVIEELNKQGFRIKRDAIKEGVKKVADNTGLKGRWQRISNNPVMYCDTAHNQAGIHQVLGLLQKQNYRKLHMIWGMVNDKNVDSILAMLPRDAIYYFCKPDIPRGLDSIELLQSAEKASLHGRNYSSVNSAIAEAKENASADDLIFVGGSTFVVAEIDDL